MSAINDKAADMAKLITDNYFARFDEATDEDKVALFANAFHVIKSALAESSLSSPPPAEKKK